jgi:serine/threonine protein kinase
MNNPAQVESIFFAALEKKSGAERAEYLDQACGGDAALRERVERLLESHPHAKDFLSRPAVDRDNVGLDIAAELMTNLAPTFGPDDGPRESRAAIDGSATLDDERGDNAESTMGLLEPTDKPGSLGRVAHYEVLDVLGSGGFGTVVKAFDEKLHRLVAIKLMSPLLAATSAPRKRFVREARSAAAVRHENVIAIYAVEDGPIPYLVMDYIAGRTLQQKIDATGPLELEDVLRIGRQIASGLAAAHAMGLIHRDIKPGNILLENGLEHVKITDFGLARAADDASITQSGFVAGTPMYMAPEQALGETIDGRADLFSLGSVLYTMCSGRPPFRAANTIAVLKRVAEDSPRPIREIIPEVPEWLCELISVLHAKNPAERVVTAENVAELLARRLAELQGPGNTPVVARIPRPMDVKPPPSESLEPGGLFRWLRFLTRRWALAAAVLATLFGSLGLSEATGVTDVQGTVIRLLSPEGTLVVVVDDPAVSVKIDGADIVITGAGVKEIRLQTGSYTVKARKNGKLVHQELVNITRNGRPIVRVNHEAPPLEAKVATRSTDASA